MYRITNASSQIVAKADIVNDILYYEITCTAIHLISTFVAGEIQSVFTVTDS